MPGREVVYLDTSALAKWYLNESFSADVERYLMEHGPVAISDLTVVEMRSLLARRRREKHVDPKMENRVFSTFEDDIRRGLGMKVRVVWYDRSRDEWEIQMMESPPPVTCG